VSNNGYRKLYLSVPYMLFSASIAYFFLGLRTQPSKQGIGCIDPRNFILQC